MSREALELAVRDLPITMERSILQFSDFATEALPDILSGLRLDVPVTIFEDRVAFASGLWRLWQMISAPIATIEAARTLLTAQGGSGTVQIGRDLYGPDTEPEQMLLSLRSELSRLLESTGASYITSVDSLSALVARVVEDT